jgi:hypothetical protein
MKQNFPKTMIEKTGFVDPDKKTPKHDKIQRWVYENPEKIIEELGILKNNPYKVVRKIWEHVLFAESHNSRNTSSIVGYIDLLIEIESENSIPNINYRSQGLLVPFYFEIKTSIPSLGDLIRQLRFYQYYLGFNRDYPFVIVCSDDSHKKILNDQGYYFYKYEDPEKLY